MLILNFFSIYFTIDKNVDAVGAITYTDSIENTSVKDTFKILICIKKYRIY